MGDLLDPANRQGCSAAPRTRPRCSGWTASRHHGRPPRGATTRATSPSTATRRPARSSSRRSPGPAPAIRCSWPRSTRWRGSGGTRRARASSRWGGFHNHPNGSGRRRPRTWRWSPSTAANSAKGSAATPWGRTAPTARSTTRTSRPSPCGAYDAGTTCPASTPTTRPLRRYETRSLEAAGVDPSTRHHPDGPQWPARLRGRQRPGLDLQRARPRAAGGPQLPGQHAPPGPHQPQRGFAGGGRSSDVDPANLRVFHDVDGGQVADRPVDRRAVPDAGERRGRGVYVHVTTRSSLPNMQENGLVRTARSSPT